MLGTVDGEVEHEVERSNGLNFAVFKLEALGAPPNQIRWWSVGEIAGAQIPMEVDHLRIFEPDELVLVATGQRPFNVGRIEMTWLVVLGDQDLGGAAGILRPYQQI